MEKIRTALNLFLNFLCVFTNISLSRDNLSGEGGIGSYSPKLACFEVMFKFSYSIPYILEHSGGAKSQYLLSNQLSYS